MRMEIRRGTIIFGFIAAVLFVAGPAVACGSMAGISRGQAFTAVSKLLFLPMVLLIPLEFFILKRFGGLGDKTWSAYAWCLLAKGLGVASVAGAALVAAFGNRSLGIIGSEAIYSAIHFLISFRILSTVFKKDPRNAVQTAALISTVIPWLYSLSIPLTYFMMAEYGF